MTDYQKHQPDELLERYLDGLLTDDELIEFEQRLESDGALQRGVEQHREFEERLNQAFAPARLTAEALESLLNKSIQSDDSNKQSGTPKPASSMKSRRRLVVGAICAIAAAIAWFFVSMQSGATRKVSPFFEQRPLALIYQETIDNGFRPYYYCEDQARFARTFRKRQATPLELSETPADRRMVGLSFAGGLSRDTTAMLAYVEEQPVVVFIDRNEFDNEQLMSQRKKKHANLFVHRKELADLVIYEVSPFDSAKMAPYLSLPPE